MAVANGYLGPDDPFRKIGFIFALGTILGAAILDISLIGIEAYKQVQRVRSGQVAAAANTDGKSR